MTSTELDRRTTESAGVKFTRRWSLGALVAMTLAGCSGAKVTMDGEIPTPLVNRLPLQVGLYLEPALVQYVFEEKIEDQGDWRIEVGPIQAKLFKQIASAMFIEAPLVDSTAPTGGTLDAVLAPHIVDFQISIPSQTHSEFYEVWIKYQMQFYDPQGTLIAEWPLTAYGKANRGDFGVLERSDTPGMRHATMTALRDAGAFLALRFASVPEIRAWLDSRTPATPGGDT